MIRIHGTDNEIKALVALAINASIPVGFGILHFQPTTYTSGDVEIVKSHRGKSIGIDYFQGRMVKIYITEISIGCWGVRQATPRIDYQSWAARYPTWEDLAKAAGLRTEEIADEDEAQAI